jgi:hypothetical protein
VDYPVVNCLARLGNIPIVDGQASQVVVPITNCLARLGDIPIVDGWASQVVVLITDCLASPYFITLNLGYVMGYQEQVG